MLKRLWFKHGIKSFILQRLSDTCSWLILAHLGSCGDFHSPPENENWNGPLVSLPFFLRASCPLKEALSRGNEGNQINCMSANRITSSLTHHESELKLITHARKNGRLWVGRRGAAGGCPRGGDSLRHAQEVYSMWLALMWVTQSTCQVMCISGGFFK